MTAIGKIREIWRYPVKSMGGEQLGDCTVGAEGLYLDRCWALRDETAGEIRGAKQMPKLLLCQARYMSDQIAGALPHVEMKLPDGTLLKTDDPKASIILSEYLGRRVTLWPLQPASDQKHYKRAQRGGALMRWMSNSPMLKPYLPTLIRYAGLEVSLRQMFVRTDAESHVQIFR